MDKKVFYFQLRRTVLGKQLGMTQETNFNPMVLAVGGDINRGLKLLLLLKLNKFGMALNVNLIKNALKH